MRLREILKGKGQVRITEYEKYGDQIIFTGGAFYDGRHILSLDSNVYPMEMDIEVFEWRDDKTLMIMR